MSENLVLNRTNQHWLFTWKLEKAEKSYYVSESHINVQCPPEAKRNLFNALYAGLSIHVKGVYDKATKILTIKP
jgi:hypothetical protein